MNLKVENPNNLPTLSITSLIPSQGELKDLSKENYNKLKASFEKHGFIFPVSVWQDKDGKNYLIDGHQRKRVIESEYGDADVPTIKIPAKNINEAAEILLKVTSQYGTITQEGLDSFIAKYELPEAEIYEATHYDAISYLQQDKDEVEEDEAPEVSDEPPVSELGKIYQLGRHRVMCGDSTDSEQLNELLQGAKPELLFTDPPYKFETQGGGVFQNSRQMNEVKANRVNQFDPTTLEAQCKTNIYFHNKSLIGDYVQLSKDWAMAYDLAIYKKPGLPNWSGHLMTDIEYIAIIGQLDPNKGMEMPMYSKVYEGKKDQDNELSYSKPIELCAKFIKLYSNKTVLDSFLGSGSTLIACEQTDRTCYGMELDPKYVDVIRKRYAKFTNDNELPDNWEDLTPPVV